MTMEEGKEPESLENDDLAIADNPPTILERKCKWLTAHDRMSIIVFLQEVADKDGKLRILPKEKIKDNIGRSPDYLDCFIMRMWYEVNQSNYYVR